MHNENNHVSDNDFLSGGDDDDRISNDTPKPEWEIKVRNYYEKSSRS